MSLRLGLGADQVKKRGISPIDPRTKAALTAGGIWLPRYGVSGSGLSVTWASQASQTNTFTVISDTAPVLSSAANGVPIWDFVNDSGTFHPFFYLGSPGTALRSSTNVAFGGWFKLAATPGGVLRIGTNWWPEGGANNRLQFWFHDDSGLVLSVNASADGTGLDSPVDRAKANLPCDGAYSEDDPGFNPLDWFFLLLRYRAGQSNYQTAGQNLSHRLEIWVLQGSTTLIWREGSGFSAGGPPPDGPVRTPLFASTAPLEIGGRGVPYWRGYVGPQYITGGDLELTIAEWTGVALFDRPA